MNLTNKFVAKMQVKYQTKSGVKISETVKQIQFLSKRIKVKVVNDHQFYFKIVKIFKMWIMKFPFSQITSSKLTDSE